MNILELAKECGAIIDVIPDETGYYTKDAWITTVVFENCTDANNEACTKYLEEFAAAISAQAIEEYKASLVPVAWMYQHKETGIIGFVDQWQIDNGFEKNNLRLQITEPLYTLSKETK